MVSQYWVHRTPNPKEPNATPNYRCVPPIHSSGVSATGALKSTAAARSPGRSFTAAAI